MENFYARTVFFVSDAERSLAFYTERLGFTLDWNHREAGRTFVFQVSLFGFSLILNQVESWTEGRAGHGRLFLGLGDDQIAALRRHITSSFRSNMAGISCWLASGMAAKCMYAWLEPNAGHSAAARARGVPDLAKLAQ